MRLRLHCPYQNRISLIQVFYLFGSFFLTPRKTGHKRYLLSFLNHQKVSTRLRYMSFTRLTVDMCPTGGPIKGLTVFSLSLCRAWEETIIPVRKPFVDRQKSNTIILGHHNIEYDGPSHDCTLLTSLFTQNLDQVCERPFSFLCFRLLSVRCALLRISIVHLVLDSRPDPIRSRRFSGDSGPRTPTSPFHSPNSLLLDFQ